MKRAQLLTPWTGTGATTADARRPKVADDFALQSWTDVTGTPAANLPPSPNLCVVEVVCADAVLAAIEASAEYGDGVLWTEDVGIPTESAMRLEAGIDTAEFNKLRAHLDAKGVRPEQLREAVGDVPNNRSRQAVATTLAAWLRNRPKGA